MFKKTMYLFQIFIVAVSLASCGGAGLIDDIVIEPEPIEFSAEDFSQGQEGYDTNCVFCHGQLEESEVRGRSTEQISFALSNVEDMKFLRLSEEEVRVVAYALNTEAPNDPDEANLFEDQTPLAARLVKTQYVNTVEDLFNLSLTEEEVSLLPEELANEKSFVTVFDAQPLQDQHILAYARIARNIIDRVNIEELAENSVACSDDSTECRDDFVDNLGLQIFRRPLTDSEDAHYQSLFSSISILEGTEFSHAASAVLRAMLQAPQFVYRTENEINEDHEVTEVDGYELASRLSYFIWQSTPDAELLAFAETMNTSGVDESDLEAQIDRLLSDPKAERAVDTFWADYTLSSISSISEASEQQAEELRTSVLETLKQNSGYNGTAIPLQSLFGIQDMVLTPDLAEDLGLNSEGEGYRNYDVSSLPERVGFLSHPGYLANIGTTSFVGRGTVMSERILCRKVPDVPDSLEEQINEASTNSSELTPRDASEFRFDQGGACLGCHRTFEPIAFAFEQFDTLGSHTTVDRNDRDLFSHGYILEEDNATETSYEDVAGLMSWLSESSETSECFASNMLLFATGREFAQNDDDAINAAHDIYIANGGTYPALIKAVAMNSLFRRIQLVTE